MQLSKNRVKIRIEPKIAYKEEGEELLMTSSFPFPETMNAIKQKQYQLCAEVTNLSDFAVTIHKFGYGKFKLLKNSIHIPLPKVMKKKIWPLKLESRESDLLMLGSNIDIPIDKLDKICVYVVTECGHIAYGTNRLLKAYVKELRKKEAGKH